MGEPGRRPPAPLISKREFIADLGAAVESGTGYAAGKIGHSQVYRLSYTIMAASLKNPDLMLQGLEATLHFESLNQLGIFPSSVEFYREFDRFYVEHLKRLDCLGLFTELMATSARIVKFYRLESKLIHFQDQEPDRSTPNNQENCYLPCFRDKRVLLVCPFAGILAERARPEIFERVWAKTGKPWFHPYSVEALEFPYGFAPETRRRYATVLELYEETAGEIQRREFDVALIGAAGLAIPLASLIKSLGKVALDLGGHLQIVFGVLGKRWRDWDGWRERYFNEAWIDMPARYKPQQTDVCDSGAYW